MTHPLTPREKVAEIVDPLVFELAAALDNAEGEPAALRRDATEVRDMRMREALSKADAILTALAPGSGDHAELARLAEAATPGEWLLDGHQCLSAPDGTIVVDYSCYSRGEWEADAAYLRAVQPSRTLALLAENAALRAAKWEVKHVDTMNDMVLMGMARDEAETRATEAERKLAEAVGLLREAIEPYEHISDVRAFEVMRHGVAQKVVAIRTFLSKEAERG